jgi:hypothetical protein
MAESDRDRQPACAPRRGRTTPLGTETGTLGQSAFARAGFSDPTLVLRWEEIAGAETASLAKPIRLSQGRNGGVLTVKAEPGAALFLQHDSRALCERINAFLGRPAVSRLRFVQGTIFQRVAAPPARGPKRPLGSEDPAQKYQGPQGLRQALLRLATSRQQDC